MTSHVYLLYTCRRRLHRSNGRSSNSSRGARSREFPIPSFTIDPKPQRHKSLDFAHGVFLEEVPARNDVTVVPVTPSRGVSFSDWKEDRRTPTSAPHSSVAKSKPSPFTAWKQERSVGQNRDWREYSKEVEEQSRMKSVTNTPKTVHGSTHTTPHFHRTPNSRVSPNRKPHRASRCQALSFHISLFSFGSSRWLHLSASGNPLLCEISHLFQPLALWNRCVPLEKMFLQAHFMTKIGCRVKYVRPIRAQN